VIRRVVVEIERVVMGETKLGETDEGDDDNTANSCGGIVSKVGWCCEDGLVAIRRVTVEIEGCWGCG
jgi:hypothetical protein